MTTATESVTTENPEETEEFAARFASDLYGGDVLSFSGDLGSGKTTFIRGLAKGLGADSRSVSSPSYTLINMYEGETRLVHVDLYRLGDESEIVELGLEDLLDKKTVFAVEWGERLPNSINSTIDIRLEVTGDAQRQITIRKQKKA